MSVRLVSSDRPAFQLSGNGELVFFSVFEDSEYEANNDRKLWEIRPVEVRRIADVPQITYGSIPPGFQQTFPQSGDPLQLVEGKTYQAGGPAHNADGGFMRFTIKNGKRLPVADEIVIQLSS